MISYARGLDHIRVGRRLSADFTDACIGCLCHQYKFGNSGNLVDQPFQPRPGIVRSRIGIFKTTGLSLGITTGLNTKIGHLIIVTKYLRSPRGNHHYDLPAGALGKNLVDYQRSPFLINVLGKKRVIQFQQARPENFV